MEVIVEKIVIFSFEEIFSIFEQKARFIKEEFLFRIEKDASSEEFTLVGRMRIPKDHLYATVKTQLEMNNPGEQAEEYVITTESRGFVCRKVTNGVTKEKISQSDLILDTKIFKLLSDDGIFGKDYFSLRVRNKLLEFYNYPGELSTLRDFVNQEKPPVLFGKKSWNELASALTAKGIPVENLPAYNWF